MFICQDDVANVIQFTSNFPTRKHASLINICTIGFEENIAYLAT